MPSTRPSPNPNPDRPGPEAALRAALEYHRSGRLRQAEALYRRILAAHPAEADALQYLGLLRVQQGELEEARNLLRKALALQPQAAVLHYNLGLVQQRQGQWTAAAASYRKALALDATFAFAHVNLGLVLQGQGRIPQAIEQYRRALSSRPDCIEGHINLGLALVELGRYEAAAEALNEARQLDPHHPDAHHALGVLAQETGAAREAEGHFRRVLETRPDDGEAHLGLANALESQGRLEEALESAESALRCQPPPLRARTLQANVLSRLGRLGEAENSYRQALEREPDHPEIHCELGNLLVERGCDLEAREHLERAYAGAPNDARICYSLVQAGLAPAGLKERLEQRLAAEPRDGERKYLCFAAGRLDHQEGHYDRAFARWSEGNQIQRRELDFDPEEWAEPFALIKATFTPELFARHRGRGFPSAEPIFIVGMPRSGTTLTEQILSSHPAVYGAGELSLLPDLVARLPARVDPELPYPECVRELAGDDFLRIGEDYASRLRALNAAARHLCDKLPANFLHLGLIALALPEARIIHCVRHPLDTCLSCFSLLFQGKSQPYSYSLEDLGRHYLLYRDLMDHWRRVLPRPIFEVSYESLVGNQRQVTRDLLAFCNLPWDERCLEFHRNGRAVRTASTLQVRKPLYATSVRRWRHYRRHLEPLRALFTARARR